MTPLNTLKANLMFVIDHIKLNPSLTYADRMFMINESFEKTQADLQYSKTQIKMLVHTAGVSLISGKVVGSEKLRYQLRNPANRVPLKLAKQHCNLALVESF